MTIPLEHDGATRNEGNAAPTTILLLGLSHNASYPHMHALTRPAPSASPMPQPEYSFGVLAPVFPCPLFHGSQQKIQEGVT